MLEQWLLKGVSAQSLTLAAHELAWLLFLEGAKLWCGLGQETLKKVSDSGGTSEAALLFK